MAITVSMAQEDNKIIKHQKHQTKQSKLKPPPPPPPKLQWQIDYEKEVDSLLSNRLERMKSLERTIAEKCLMSDSELFILTITTNPDGSINKLRVMKSQLEIFNSEEMITNCMMKKIEIMKINLGELKPIGTTRQVYKGPYVIHYGNKKKVINPKRKKIINL